GTVGVGFAPQRVRLPQPPGRRSAQGRRLGTRHAGVARGPARRLHLHARAPRPGRQPRQEPADRPVWIPGDVAGLGGRAVNRESSRPAMARNLLVLVAGSGLIIALVGLSAIALLRRSAERSARAAMEVLAQQAAARIGSYP